MSLGLAFLFLLWIAIHDVQHVVFCRGKFETVRLALATFRSVYPTINVNTLAYNWCVPEEDAWPLETRGVRLGEILSRIKRRGDFVNRHAEDLTSLGVISEMSKNDLKFERFVEALRSFQLKHGHTKVPAKFVDASGYRLGEKSESIRRQNLYGLPAQRKILNQIGFFFGPKRRIQSDETILLALRTYKKNFNDLHVPFRFIIPEDKPLQWPKEVAGVKLGHVVSRIRNRGSYKHLRMQLDALEFPWIVWKDAQFVSLLTQLSEMELSRLERKYSLTRDDKSV